MNKRAVLAGMDMRERLRKHLSRFRLPEEQFARLWEYLGIAGALDVEDEDDFSVLCEQAENLNVILRVDRQRESQMRPVGESPIVPGYDARMRDLAPDRSKSVLTDSERARNTALNHYRVRQASFDRSVQWFRREVLGGKLLEESDALTYAASPVLAILSREDLAEYNLSSVDQSIQDVEESREYNADEHKVHWHVTGTVMPSGIKMNINRQGEPHPPILWCMALQADGNYWRTGRVVRESSVLHDLLGVSELLMRQHGWDDVDATVFILTGGKPRSTPIEIKTDYVPHERPVTTIKVEPWVSWKTIEKVYKAEQKNVYDVVPGEIGKRNAALFSFVAGHIDEDGALPGKGARRALMDSWNERADDLAQRWEAAGQSWRFSDLQAFNRNLVRAHEEVLYPKYPDSSTRLDRWYAAIHRDIPPNQSSSVDNHLDNQEEK